MIKFTKTVISFLIILTFNKAYASDEISANYFDPLKYEIESVKLGQLTNVDGQYTIYANGNMQAPVDVTLEIYDKGIEQKRVLLNKMELENGDPLISLYLKKEGPVDGLLLMNQKNKHGWALSNVTNQYESLVETGSEYNLRINENYVVYYVSTDKSVNHQEICVKIADSYDSCGNGNASSANIKAIPSPVYQASDFSFLQYRTDWPGYPGDRRLGGLSYYELKITGKKNAYIKNISVVVPIVGNVASAQNLIIASQISRTNNRIPVGSDWNHNTTLFLLPQKEEVVTSFYIPFHDYWKKSLQLIPQKMYQRKGMSYFYQLNGVIHWIAAKNYKGLWGASNGMFNTGTMNRPLKITDNYGNEKTLLIKFESNRYVIY